MADAGGSGSNWTVFDNTSYETPNGAAGEVTTDTDGGILADASTVVIDGITVIGAAASASTVTIGDVDSSPDDLIVIDVAADTTPAPLDLGREGLRLSSGFSVKVGDAGVAALVLWRRLR